MSSVGLSKLVDDDEVWRVEQTDRATSRKGARRVDEGGPFSMIGEFELGGWKYKRVAPSATTGSSRIGEPC